MAKTTTNLGPVYLSSDVPPLYRHLYKCERRQAYTAINSFLFIFCLGMLAIDSNMA